jgi:hypothetical protein
VALVNLGLFRLKKTAKKTHSSSQEAKKVMEKNQQKAWTSRGQTFNT